jgi:hypothetical protein
MLGSLRSKVDPIPSLSYIEPLLDTYKEETDRPDLIAINLTG